MRHVYVIGLPETGGCWISRGEFWTDHAKAWAELIKRRSESGTSLQLFTLELSKES